MEEANKFKIRLKENKKSAARFKNSRKDGG